MAQWLKEGKTVRMWIRGLGFHSTILIGQLVRTAESRVQFSIRIWDPCFAVFVHCLLIHPDHSTSITSSRLSKVHQSTARCISLQPHHELHNFAASSLTPPPLLLGVAQSSPAPPQASCLRSVSQSSRLRVKLQSSISPQHTCSPVVGYTCPISLDIPCLQCRSPQTQTLQKTGTGP